ncbi:MAG: hypothetical protein IT480_19295 [Gammaproteobacteria bacterium]|nr:hypothetical protein [Gammaproteobacteria bacterium]
MSLAEAMKQLLNDAEYIRTNRTPAAALSAAPVAQEPAWRYEIQQGPDGETDWAWVYDAENNLVCTAKTYHAAAIVRASSPPATPAGLEEDWRDDPSADERWQAGLDYGMERFCSMLGVDPKDVRWDAATEELDGDVCAVIGNILRVKFGDDFDPMKPLPSAGLGADEIARVFARWKNSKNLHESLAAQNIEKELLALLSRAGDQSNSTQKDGSR